MGKYKTIDEMLNNLNMRSDDDFDDEEGSNRPINHEYKKVLNNIEYYKHIDNILPDNNSDIISMLKNLDDNRIAWYFKSIILGNKTKVNTFYFEADIEFNIFYTEHIKKYDYKLCYNYSSSYVVLYSEEHDAILYIAIYDTNKSIIGEISIYYKEDNILTENVNNFCIEHNKINNEKPGVHLMLVDNEQLKCKKFDIKSQDVNINENYNDDFVEIYDNLIESLNEKNESGLYILHGEPGSGKTTLLRHLCTVVKNKKIIFLPPSMTEAITSPNLISFFLQHENSIFIIEEAEKIITSRSDMYNLSSSGVHNLLNISDGILGDCLKTKIILTFNTGIENIDQALLRDGRLKFEHKFDKLSLEKTKNIFKKLGYEDEPKEAMVLSEIFNHNKKAKKSDKINKKTQIGFKSNN